MGKNPKGETQRAQCQSCGTVEGRSWGCRGSRGKKMIGKDVLELRRRHKSQLAPESQLHSWKH